MLKAYNTGYIQVFLFFNSKQIMCLCRMHIIHITSGWRDWIKWLTKYWCFKPFLLETTMLQERNGNCLELPYLQVYSEFILFFLLGHCRWTSGLIPAMCNFLTKVTSECLNEHTYLFPALLVLWVTVLLKLMLNILPVMRIGKTTMKH